jgi:Domain of unknown function (DUF4832)/Domain of unknown function (DUF4874)
MRKLLYSAISAFCLFYFVGCKKSDSPAIYTPPKQDTVQYIASEEDFPNPDRGFYHVVETSADAFVPLDHDQIRSWHSLQRGSGGGIYNVYSTLVFRNIVLTGFTNQPLSADLLTAIGNDFATVRSAGMKLILRFSYTSTANSGSCPEGFICPPYGDAPKQIVLNHISQLKLLLYNNADVISCMQMGFVGTWGENYYSDYFGDPSSNGTGRILDQNWTDKASVIAALLKALPADRMIQVRTPQQKQRYLFGPSAPVTVAGMTGDQAYAGTDVARIGFHNDCLLSSPDDYGTYDDYGNSNSPRQSALGVLKDYLMNDGKFTPVGGETCDDSYSPFNDCEPSGQAQTELRQLHYSFLNCDYNNAVNNDWETGGCMDAIRKNLGYRFVLNNTIHPDDPAVKGKTYSFTIDLDNLGYAAPFNDHPAKIILRNKADNKEYPLDAGTDVRTWYPGKNMVNISLLLNDSLPSGTFNVFLVLPDKYTRLWGRSDYSIRLANENVWEATDGYNNLLFDLTIK